MEKQIDPWTAEIVLEGQKIRLEPGSNEHLESLCGNLLYTNSWHGIHWNIQTKEDFCVSWMERAILSRQNKIGNCFVMIEKHSNEAVGVSSFMNLNRKNRYLEIGATWIGQRWQKTFVNTEAKFLMLQHAFEELHCQRVEFRVDSLNFNSQKAVERIGATLEGELRQSMLLPDGRKRNYKVYSILDHEWANLKKTLIWYSKRAEAKAASE